MKSKRKKIELKKQKKETFYICSGDGECKSIVIDEEKDLRQFKKDMEKLLKMRRNGELPCPVKTSCHSV